jgi:small subunit ribosomal protein S20
MPRIKSSIKDVRRTKTRRTRNHQALASLRTAVRKARTATGDAKAGVLKETIQVIDKAIQNGYIHLNTGSRYKSRLTKTKKALPAKAA